MTFQKLRKMLCGLGKIKVVILMVLTSLLYLLTVKRKFIMEVELKDSVENNHIKSTNVECDSLDYLPRPHKIHLEDKNFSIDCTKPFVAVMESNKKESRGLANNIVGYLTLAVLNRLYGLQVFLNIDMVEEVSKIFNDVKLPVVMKKHSTCDKFHKKKKMRFKEVKHQLDLAMNDDKSDPSNQHLPSSIALSDFPSDYPMLMGHSHLLIKELKFHPDYKMRVKILLFDTLGEKRMRQIKKKQITLISLYVGGDHKTKNRNQIVGVDGGRNHDPCYFNSAMEYFRKRHSKLIFIVAGTNQKWNKKYITGKDVFYTDPDSEGQPELDLAMLSMCDHHIMSQGAFSFLTGYLGSGTIVYPLESGRKPNLLELSILCSNSSRYVPIPDCGRDL